MIVIFLGPPGSGKGTQAERISREFELKPLSTGALLRSEIAAGTKLGKKMQASVEAGKLVGDDVVLELIEKQFEKNSGAKGFILDGFPRTVIQAKKLSSHLAGADKKLDFVIELDVAQDSLLERLTNRYQCQECGADYNKLFKNPVKEGVCDVCGSAEFGVRNDDRKEVIERRFKEYKALTAPLLPYYNTQGALYKVNGNQAPDMITEEIRNILKNVLT